MGSPVAELRRPLGGVPEGAVEGRGVLHGVGHDRNVLEAVLVQPLSDALDHAVNHSARGDDVASRQRVAHRDPGPGCPASRRSARIPLGSTGLSWFSTPQWPWSVYSQRHTSVTTRRSGRACFSARIARWMMPSSSKFSSPRRILRRRNPEEQHGRDPLRLRPGRLLDRTVDRELADTRHGSDGGADSLAMHHEHRVDEVAGTEPGLAHRFAQPRGMSQAARPVAPVDLQDRGGVHCIPPGVQVGIIRRSLRIAR